MRNNNTMAVIGCYCRYWLLLAGVIAVAVVAAGVVVCSILQL